MPETKSIVISCRFGTKYLMHLAQDFVHAVCVVLANGFGHGKYSDCEDVGSKSDPDDIADLEFETRLGYFAVDLDSALLTGILGDSASLDYS